MEPEEIVIEHPELRFGYIAQLYYRAKGKRMPKQLDLLYTWFPDLFITVRDSDLTVKEEPEYNDIERMIYATRYHTYLYSGGNSRIAHITGRLIGTSSSNLEKERKSGELIQKQTARKLLYEIEALPAWLDHIRANLDALSEEEGQFLHHLLYIFCLEAADARALLSDYDKDNELYAFDEEVFSGIIYNAMVQLCRYEWEGLWFAFAWLLLGSLLRNTCGRLVRTFDSGFVPVRRIPSEDGSLEDQLRCLLFPEQYEQFYIGDDLEKRFPGIEWYCDSCGAHLNEQEGFDDGLEAWQCRRCGTINPLSEKEIYENIEEARYDLRRKMHNDMAAAVEARKKQLNRK
jgi:hypothetical protein